jgi:aryl-alcohol dehydrogenase-like predicted oxidoreductase
VALGTVKLGRNTDVKYPESFALPDDAAVDRLLEAAWDLGVRMLDTAPAYGRSEERLGPFVRRHRDDLVLCTKAGEEYGPEGSSWHFGGEHLRRSLDRSLRRLGTDRVDILLLHSDGDDLRRLEEGDAVETLLRLKEEGKARSVGISAKTETGVRGAARALDVVMAPYSLSAPGLAEALAEVHTAGLGTVGIKALGSGRLARGAHGGRTALAHALSRPFLDVVVIGTLDPSHLAQAVEEARRVSREPKTQ